jgi:beta-mannosidase
MFRSYRVDVASLLQTDNELVIVFRSLTAALKKKRPRPRWKTNLVPNQQLRWQRTSLLGRIPGWTPPVPAVGPWRAVRLECAPVLLSDIQRTTTLNGDTGVVTFCAHVDASVQILSAQLRIGAYEASLELENRTLRGELRVPHPQLWWPHTHGEAHLFECKVVIETAAGPHEFPLTRVGQRATSLHSQEPRSHCAMIFNSRALPA